MPRESSLRMAEERKSRMKRAVGPVVVMLLILCGVGSLWIPGGVLAGRDGDREGRNRSREQVEAAARRKRRPAPVRSRPKKERVTSSVGPVDFELRAGSGKPGADSAGRQSEERAGGGPEADNRYDKPREAQQFFLSKRLPEGERDLSSERYLAARREMARMEQFSTALNRVVAADERVLIESPLESLTAQSGSWTPLGPGNIGGRTRAILIDPGRPETIYAAGVTGGVWKTTNGGASWVALTDILPVISVSSMAMDPTNSQVIYVGTGEGVSAFSRDTQGDFRGAGIFKTTDGGATWTRLEATGSPDFYFVNDLIVSRKDRNRIYAATRTGIWRSIDGGGSWSRTLRPLNDSNQPVTGGCLDLTLRTDRSADTLFGACGTFEQATVYRNLDAAAGDAWTAVLSEVDMGRTALAIAPSDQNVIYAIASSIEAGPFESALHAVFRSTSGGDAGTWVPQVRNTTNNPVARSLLSIPTLAMATICGFGEADGFFGQGWYDLTIAVDPRDANRVWVGGIDIFRSDDGGSTWGMAGPSYVGRNYDDGTIHPDHHVIVFHPQYDGAANQQMFVGNDGGVYRTLNARGPVATSPQGACDPSLIGIRWQPLNAGYSVTQFYHGAVSPDGKAYFGGTQDNGTVLGTDAAGINGWVEINGGDGGYAAFDSRDPRTLYAAFTDISIRKSTDGGKTFGPANSGIADSGFFIAPYVIDPSDPQRLWTGGDYLWRTNNGAGLWFRASAITPGASQVSALAISPGNANRMLAGMGDGFILRSDQALSSTSQTSWQNTQPRAGFVSSLTFDPRNPDVAYATYSTFGGNHVWKTVNGGVTWASIDGSGSGQLPDIPAHSLVVDPSNPARLYLGTDLGVFVTNNGGSSWSVEFTGFASAITESLQININDGRVNLYAFTHGRGVWRVEVGQTGCSYALTPSTITLAPGQQSGTLEVTASPAVCSWQSQSNEAWLNVDGGGTANGRARFSVEANSSFASRTGTATIAGRTLTIIQPGKVDIESPVLTVTDSSTSPGTINTGGVLSLAGTVADDDQVAQVSWSTDRKISGTAILTDSNRRWNIGAIPLAPGLNRISLTALDRTGNVGYANWSVNSIPSSTLVTVIGDNTPGYAGDGQSAIDAQLTRPIRIAIDLAGNLFFTDSDNNVVRRLSASGIVTTVAGTGFEGFSGDGGPAVQATLNFPTGIAVDIEGNLYICDNGNSRIRKVTVSTGIITTVAGTGTNTFSGDGGSALNASLNNPQTVAVDRAGNIYIADFSNHRIRKVTASDGRIQTVAGTSTSGFSGDSGPAVGAQLNSPNSVFVDAVGNLLISDAGNNRIRRVTIGDGVIRTVAGNGSRSFAGDGGPAVDAALSSPAGAISDSQGNIIITDRGNQRIRRIAASTGIITTIAGNGQAAFNGDGLAALATALNFPTGLALDPSGGLWFSDRENGRVRRFVNATSDSVSPVVTITGPTSQPALTTSKGSLEIQGTASDNQGLVALGCASNRGGICSVRGLSSWKIAGLQLQAGLNQVTVTAWDASGNSRSATLAITLQGREVMMTIAGNGTPGDSGDGSVGAAARLFQPSAITLDAAGNLYIADTGNHRIRKVTPGGEIQPFAGSGQLGATGDGGPALAASFNSPGSLAFDSRGNLYIADTGNNRIRRVSPDGKVTTVAGDGRDNFSGDGGPATAASLYQPYGVAVDSADNLYIADTGNLRIRKVTTATGRIETIAGDGRFGSGGDGGPALAANFRFPYGLATARNGSVFVVDGDDHRVRRIDSAGRISPYAGSGRLGDDGDGGPAVDATLNYPSFINTDAEGNLYIADYGNHTVRRVTAATGIISTVIGTSLPGDGIDGLAPLSTDLSYPNDVAIDSAGTLYVADTGNDRIRRALLPGTLRLATATSAASYATSMARDSLAAIFGTTLSAGVSNATQLPLPTALGGSFVTLRDASGITRLTPLFFTSPNQINVHIPPSTAVGTATMTVSGANGQLSTGLINIGSLAPGIFSANADAKGVPAATLLRVKPGNQISYEPVARYDAVTAQWVPLPIDFGPPGDQIFLALFGTGWRNANQINSLSATIGGLPAQVVFAGKQGDFVGLDQINLALDPKLAGRGALDIRVSVDGLTSNTVQVIFK